MGGSVAVATRTTRPAALFLFCQPGCSVMNQQIIGSATTGASQSDSVRADG